MNTELRDDCSHILLAEDDDAMREMLAFCLYRDGYRVTTCGDGLSLYRLLEAGATDFDLVITDIRMPALTGTKVLEAISDLQHRPPVLCMTAFGDEATRRQACQLGAIDLLDKPFDIDEFIEKVRRLCPAQRPALAL
ncbi:MAG: response regulator [Deltaproteobacteria bacterium]|nr:MAG: response regulator [Deltaproteobacteria bacterium]